MNNLKYYILEKLKITKDSKINKDHIFDLYSEKFSSRIQFRRYISKIKEFDDMTISFLYSYMKYDVDIYLYEIDNNDKEFKNKIDNALITNRMNIMGRNFETSDVIDAKGFKGKFSKTNILIDNKTKYMEIFVINNNQEKMYLILQNERESK